jgi:hypothetical protein
MQNTSRALSERCKFNYIVALVVASNFRVAE